MTVMEIVSPTKCHIHANEYYYVEFSDKIKKRQYKLINEGFKEMTNFLDKFKTKEIWFANDICRAPAGALQISIRKQKE